MGYTKPKKITEVDLCNAELPKHGKTYTVIPHKSIIDYTDNLLRENNFVVKNKKFRSNAGAKVAQGIYEIVSTHDDDLGMMFAWTNSYDKSTRFQCGIGAYVFVCNNGMIHGDMASYARKHTGTAHLDVQTQIGSQVKYAHKHFNQLIQDKEQFKSQSLTKKNQSELLGRLFIEEEIIDATQMSTVKREMNKPSFNYNCVSDNAWSFYNHVTHALKSSHPRSWMSNQQKFHRFMTTELLSHLNIKNRDLSAYLLKNYKLQPKDNIYDGNTNDLELHEYDTFIDFKI